MIKIEERFPRIGNKRIVRLATLLLLISILFVTYLGVVLEDKSQIYDVVITLSEGSGTMISPYIWGINDHYWTHANSVNDVFYGGMSLKTAQSMGINVFRFPGGCAADNFNWQDSNHQMTRGRDEFNYQSLSISEGIKLAHSIGAAFLFQANIEAKGRINPCGDIPLYPGKSEDENKAILLQDIKDIVNQYGNDIDFIELGNEQWSSYNPDEYFEIALIFAQEIKKIKPNIPVILVGQYENPAWTAMIKEAAAQQCRGVPCFDMVSDHPYFKVHYDPKGANITNNFPGMTAYIPSAILSTDIARRQAEYAPLAYVMTEWNLQYWGTGERIPIPIKNPTFSDHLDDWIVSHPDMVGENSHHAAINNQTSKKVSLYQDVGDIPPNAQLLLYLEVRTNNPQSTRVEITQANPGPSQGSSMTVQNLNTIQPNEWQDAAFYIFTREDTEAIRITLSSKDRDASSTQSSILSEFDALELFNITGFSKLLSRDTAEHTLFLAESFLTFASQNMYLTNNHWGYSNGFLSQLVNQASQEIKPNGLVFQMTSALAGMELLSTQVQTTELQRIKPMPGYCNHCWPLGSDVEQLLPTLSALSGYDPQTDKVLLYIINKHAEKAAQVSLNVINFDSATVTELSADSFSATTMAQQEYQLTSNRLILPPISMVKIEFEANFGE